MYSKLRKAYILVAFISSIEVSKNSISKENLSLHIRLLIVYVQFYK